MAELGADPSIAQLVDALNQAAAAFEKTVSSENLQQSLSALGDAIASLGSQTESAKLMALDVDAKLSELESKKQDAGDFLTQKQLEKRFLDKAAGGKVAGNVAFSGKTSASELDVDELRVDFAKFFNASPKKKLSDYILHLQGATLPEL